MAGLNPEGYTNTDFTIDLFASATIGRWVKLAEWANLYGQFKLNSKESIRALWYLNGPMGLGKEYATEVLKTLNAKEIEELGSAIGHVM